MTVTCPHCARVLDVHGGKQHVAACLDRPGLRDLTRRLMQDASDPTQAIGRREYNRAVIAHNVACGPDDLRALRENSLSRICGGWAEACAWAGLERKPQYPAAPAQISNAHAQAQPVTVRRHYYHPCGLPVYAVRSLPDGRTAYMLR